MRCMKTVLKRKAAFVDKAVAFFLFVQAVFATSIFDASDDPCGVSVDQKRQESLDPQAVVLLPDFKGSVWLLEGQSSQILFAALGELKWKECASFHYLGHLAWFLTILRALLYLRWQVDYLEDALVLL